MTEDEAKTKWCPFAQSRVLRASKIVQWVSEPKDPNSYPTSFCIASECMAWRWGITPQDAANRNRADHIEDGYCGLAGKPS